MKLLKTLLFAWAIPVCICLTACDTDIEPIDQSIIKPDQSDPAHYAAYLEALRTYKASEHFIVYASLENAPSVPVSEKAFLRSLPDSLDIVALTNADRLTEYDIEDIPEVQKKGTKVLYAIDYNILSQTMDGPAFAKRLDEALATVTQHGLDGLVVTYDGPIDARATEAEAAIVSKFSAQQLMLVWEGNPLFVSKANRDKFAYCILSTREIGNTFNLRSHIDYAMNFAGIPAEKIILSSDPTGRLQDAALQYQPSVLQTAKCVIEFGPLAGLSIYHIGEDYFDPYLNYSQTKQAIALLNPAAK